MPSPTLPSSRRLDRSYFSTQCVAPLDEGANGGRGRVEDVDAVLLDHLPPAAAVRRVGGPFIDEDRRPGRQRAVDHVGMARDPAHVGRTPVDVVVANVEHPLGRLLGEEVVAGRGVHDALGLAGRAAGIKDEQRRLAVQRLGGAVVAGFLDQFVPPEVAAGGHRHGVAGAAEHDALLDRRRLLQGERRRSPSAAIACRAASRRRR